jgi:diguanylate cyclase (GGDEF)-like protein/PAS domain S-box-containing protein
MSAHNLQKGPRERRSAAPHDDHDAVGEVERLRRDLADFSVPPEGSKRHEAEARLSSSDAVFGACVDGMVDGVALNSAIRDETGRIVDFRIDYANESLSRMTGLTPEELIGHRILELFPGRRRSGVFDDYVRVVESGQPLVRNSVPSRPDSDRTDPHGFGSEFDVSVTKVGDGYAICMRDTRARLRAEKALRESEQLLASIVENIPIMVFVKDARDLRFVRVNPATEQALGFSRDELVGQEDQGLAPADESAFFASVERDVLQTGQTVDVPEEFLTTRHHGRRVLHTRKIPILDEAGKPKYLLGISEDITDLKASEEGRRQAQEALRERVRVFAALAEFAAAVNAIREPERLVATFGDAVSSILPSDTVVVTTLDRGDGLYHVRSARGLVPGAVGAIIEPGEGTAGRAISERAVILREHKTGDQYSAALRGYQICDTSWALGVPLINEGSVLGVISVGRFETDATFTPSEIEVFGLLGSHAALALANAYLVEDVSALAIHDGLTGLYNRRHFDAELDHLIARFKRRAPAGNLATIMFDLDHFGDFNRRHGHLVGDAVLRLFAGVLHERLRSADLVARFGGEEFIVILEDCGLPEVVRMAEEVRRGLEARTVPGADGQPLRVTVSAGCAVIDPADPTREALIGRADVALVMAKRAGRNQVVAA